MKTWKLITILALTLTIAGAAVASAYAFCWWGIGTATPYNPLMGTANQYGNQPRGVATNGAPANPTTVTIAPTQEPPTTSSVPSTQETTQPPTLYTPIIQTAGPAYSGYGRGWGCMGNWGYGANYQTGTTTPLTITQATQIAQTYVASLNNPDLEVVEVEEYTANFYVAVGEKSTGYGAFELLINPTTGVVTAERGPNMMWNTKYSFNGGYCNWLGTTQTTATPTVTAEQAETTAQQYLNSYLSGTTVGDITTFYGYYTLEVLNNGNPYGMLSVNAYTGQVWYHTWHGTFVQEAEVS